MASYDTIPSVAKDQENIYQSETRPMSNKFIETDTTCQKVFEKIEHFNQETTTLTDSENLKKKITSIYVSLE